MNNKHILLEKYIKVSIRKALKEQEELQKQAEKSLYLIYRFPGLKETMENLMSPSFNRFVKNVELVAPKPTTFSIKLINSQEFNIKYLGKGKFSIKVAGKKYNPINLGELERASQAISDLLQLNYAPEEGKEQISNLDNELEKDLKGVEPTENPSPESPPSEETPEPLAANNKLDSEPDTGEEIDINK